MLEPYGRPTARSDTGLVCDQHLKRLGYHLMLDVDSVFLLVCYNREELVRLHWW